MRAQFHIADLFEITAAAVPERTALVSGNHRRSYAELDARSTQLAAGLAKHGVRRGDHVGLFLMNCPEYMEAFLAALKLGAVPFNVNYRYREEELLYLFDNADAVAVVHGAAYTPVVEALARQLPALTLCVAVGSGADSGTSLEYEALLDDDVRIDSERSEDDYLLLYTGGTTGMPKGVMWPHKAFFYACLNGGGHFHPSGPINTADEIAERARGGYRLSMLTVAPLMHGAAIWSALSCLLGGLTLVLDPSPFDPETLWTLVEREGVNIIQVVGDAMAVPLRDALLAHPARWNLDSVVSFGSGGAVFSGHVKDDIRKLLPNAQIVDGLGSSESGIVGTAEPSDEGMMRIPAHDDQQVIVDDRIGGVGELGLVGRAGPIPRGYYKDPEKTADAFRTVAGKRWSVTGDNGRLDADGRITVFGRGSTCINTGGEKVYPEEVEGVLRAHPAVGDAVVTSRPDERWGQRVVAILAPDTRGVRPDFDALKRFASAHLANYKVPREILWVEEVPRSPAGKQDYRWARDYAARHGQ